MARTFLLNCCHTTPELSQIDELKLCLNAIQLALSLSDGWLAGWLA